MEQYVYVTSILMLVLSNNKVSQVCAAGFCDTTWIFQHDPNMIFTPNVSRINIGEEMHFSCRTGSYLRGPERVQCGRNGRLAFASPMLSCEGIRCGIGSLYRPHLVKPWKDLYRYNETVSLQCDEGYILRGPPSARCTENRYFDIPSTFACEAEVRCHRYNEEINVLHLVVTPDKYEYRYNERVSLKCEAGYILQGPSTATCVNGFNVSSPPFCLAEYCDADWIYSKQSNMVFSSHSNPKRLKVGESIKLSCREGYRLRGYGSIKCLPSGELEGSGLSSYCEKISCDKSSELRGIIITPDQSSYDFNDTIHFHCAQDRKMIYGPTSARCSEQGWEYEGPSLPFCGNRYCDATWLGRKGIYTTPSNPGMVPIGTRLRTHCHENNNLRCGRSLYCMPNGYLDVGMMCQCDDTHCYRNSNDTFAKPHLITTPSKGRYRYNETLSLSCEQGFILRGSSSARCSGYKGFKLSLNEEPECVREPSAFRK